MHDLLNLFLSILIVLDRGVVLQGCMFCQFSFILDQMFSITTEFQVENFCMCLSPYFM